MPSPLFRLIASAFQPLQEGPIAMVESLICGGAKGHIFPPNGLDIVLPDNLFVHVICEALSTMNRSARRHGFMLSVQVTFSLLVIPHDQKH
jgi:hypothetical protein